MKNYKLYFTIVLFVFLNLIFNTTLIAKSIKVERSEVLKKLKMYPYLLSYVDEKYKNDKGLVLATVKKNGRTLKYASKKLQDNEKIVLEAVKSNGGALAYASSRLKDDDDIVSIAIDSYGTYLEYASKRLQDDEEIVMDALRSNGANLQYASKRLRANKWYVSLAIKNNSSALEYASKVLKNDRDLVLSSIRTYSSNLSYASKALQDDKELVKEAIIQDGRALRYASKRLKNDKEIVLLAIEKDVENLAYASEELQIKFGKNESKKFQIKFNPNVENLASVPLGIKSSLALAQISIIHNTKKNKNVVGRYNIPKGEPVNYYTSINLKDIKDDNSTLSIVALGIDGEKYIIEKQFSQIKKSQNYKQEYNSKDEALNAFTEQKYKRHIMKLRMKDEVAYGAFMVMHPMLKSSYIKHIVGRIGNKIVFDFHCSSILREDPFFRFTFNAPNISGKLEIVVTDNKGEKKHFYKAYEI